MDLPVHNVPGFPTEYRGWNIWEWTGWKDEGKATLNESLVRSQAKTGEIPRCPICDEILGIGQLVRVAQGTYRTPHWKCLKGSDDVPQNLAAQWLAHKKGRYAYASAPGEQGLYTRGSNFKITSDCQIDENTPAPYKEAAQKECFARLCAVIDGFEGESRKDQLAALAEDNG